MPEINLDTLTDMQFDVLKEIGNIGAGNATTALSQMINMKIDMNVPKGWCISAGKVFSSVLWS